MTAAAAAAAGGGGGGLVGTVHLPFILTCAPLMLVVLCWWWWSGAGKALLDKMKSDGEAIASAAPKSERVQPYKSQYLTLCKGYVDAMKEHQKVSGGHAGGGGPTRVVSEPTQSRCCSCRSCASRISSFVHFLSLLLLWF